jgi:LacI family transcriptional regulator
MKQVRRVTVMIDLSWSLLHHHEVFAGIHKYARERGNWECSTDPHADLALSGHGQDDRPDGIVARATSLLAKLARGAGIPVVNVWLNSPAHGLPSVFHDAGESGRMAAHHLLARGFRTFAFLGYAPDKNSDLQSAVFREVVERAGYGFRELRTPTSVANSGAKWLRFHRQLDRWIDAFPVPIGVFAGHDLLASYMIEACRRYRRKVPHEVAVVGASNEMVVCANSVPPLTSIDFGFEQVGYRAAALLDRLMNGSAPPPEPIIVAPNRLVARQSSDAFVVNNSQVAAALRFISEHAHESIDVEDVAGHVATSRRTLARLFQSELGRTVAHAITHLRLERVKRRLMEPEAILKTVAAECGFRDAVHLCKVFQRVEKMSPGDYRAQRGPARR